jgi:hypothetical protein
MLFKTYVGAVPDGVLIDGLFSDWDRVNNNLDIDVNKIANRNIDIQEYRIMQNDEYLSFYLKVDGTLMKGTSVPLILTNTEQLTQSSAVVTKSETEVKKPYTPSKPVEIELPAELLGEDKAYIFIDTDQATNTGYHPDWLTIGADHMLEIKGKEGLILSSSYHVFIGTNQNDWTWSFKGNIDAEKDSTRLETRISQNEIGLEYNEKCDVFFCVMDWSEKKDVAGNEISALPGMPLTLPETFPEFNEKINTRAEKIGIGNNSLATALNNQRKIVRDDNGIWFAFWYNNSGGKSEIMAANSADPTGSTWNAPIELVGNNGIINTQNVNVSNPTVAINSDRDRIHLVWVNNTEAMKDINYSMCTDLNNFNKSGSWKTADGLTTGCEEISTTSETCNAPSIAINSTGEPHVVWTQDIFPGKIYYTNFSSTSNSWSTPVKINGSSEFPEPAGTAVLDIDSNDNLHLAWGNLSSGEVCYRKCLSTNDSRDRVNWTNAYGQLGYDIVIPKDDNVMAKSPSLVCDSNDNIWVVVHETKDETIWYNKCTNDSWDMANTIWALKGQEYPTIGADNYGGVHCVWRNVTYKSIQYSFNSSSSSWSTPINLTELFDNYNPAIEKNVFLGSTYIGIVYTNKSGLKFNVTFHSHEIPEFPDLILPIVITSMIILVTLATKRVRKETRKNEDSGYI